MVVEGTGFVKVETVKFGDNAATSVTVESTTKLTVFTPAAAGTRHAADAALGSANRSRAD